MIINSVIVLVIVLVIISSYLLRKCTNNLKYNRQGLAMGVIVDCGTSI
jgi:hypothetical protein